MVAWGVAAGVMTAMVVWSISAGAETPVRAIEAVLCHDVPLARPTLEEIASEAAAVLREAGVVLRVDLDEQRACAMGWRPCAAELMIRVNSAPLRGFHVSIRPVGSIQFVNGRPQDTITLSLAAATDLLQQNASTASLLARVPQPARDRWIGRMLGRALAHEVGHYLLRSPHHSASGLMRANHSVELFVRSERSAFRLTTDQLRRLALPQPAHQLERTTVLSRGEARATNDDLRRRSQNDH